MPTRVTLFRMKIIILSTLVVLASCGKTSSENPIVIKSSIIGGTEVTRDDYESLSVVGLRDKTTTCSGTLVSEDLIVTAAHCVSKWQPKTRTGVSKRKIVTTPVIFYSYKKEVMHTYIRMDQVEIFPAEDYDDEANKDLAVVKLKEKAPLGYKAVPILSPDYSIQRNSELLLVGFGYRDEFNNDDNFNLPRAPHKIKIPFVEVRDTKIVVSQEHGKIGSFFGDSGGPAYLETENGLLLAGSTQGGSKVAPEGYYINLGSFKQFILDSAKKMNATAPVFLMPDEIK